MRILRILILLFALPLVIALAAAQQLRQIGMVDIPGAPGFDSVAFAKGMLLMTHTGASTVDVFDPSRRRVVAHITGLQSPRGIAVEEANGKVFVADSGNHSIAVITTQDWKLADTIPVSGEPDALLLDGTGKMLYWSDAQNGSLSLMDVTTRQNTGTVPIGGSPSYMALDASRGVVYLTLQDQREIVAVNSRLQIENRIKLNASQPTGLVYDQRTKCLYVAVRYAVLSINTETGTEVNRVPAAAGVDMLWLDAESRTVFAAGSGALLMLRADGQRLTVADEITADVKGHTVAYDPALKIVLLPGGREGRSKLLLLRPMSPNTQVPATESAQAKAQ